MADVAVGSVFAGYRVEDVAGRGGMGVVYKARQIRPDRLVALKVIAPELANDPDFRARFDQESDISASIEHPNVIPVYDVNEEEGSLYIAMRYVEGTDLRSLIGPGMEPERAARIIAQVGSALDAAHERGLVHRDIKPGNILVSAAGGQDHAYLTDFGLAKEAASKDGLTRTGEWVGTVDYVAPEQIEGGTVDARSDVYALACLLYEELTGKVPYQRDTEVAKMWAHMNEDPPSVVKEAPTVPHELEEVVQRGMAKKPEDRYPSAGDLGRAALAASQGLTVPAGERSVARGAAAPASTEAGGTVAAGTREAAGATAAVDAGSTRAAATAGAVKERPAWRRPGVVVAAGAVVLALIGVGIAVMLGGGGGSKKAGKVIGAPIPAGKAPTAITAAGGSVWVANLKGGDVTRISQKSGQPMGDVRVGRQPYGVAVGKEGVWVALLKDNAVVRIDPSTNKVVGTPIPVGRGPSDVAVGFGSVWVANFDDGTVSRINPRAGKVVRTIKVGQGPTDVAIGEGGVWVPNVDDDTLTRINPVSNEVLGAAIPVGQSPESVAVGAGFVWVTNIKADKLTRVNPDSNTVEGAPTQVGSRPDDVAVGLGGVWVANLDADTVTRVDPKTAKVVGKPIQVGDGPATVAVGKDLVWVGEFRADSVVRIRP